MFGSLIARLMGFSLIGPFIAVIAKFFESLLPLVKGAADALVVFGATIWEGIVDILDNWKTIITVATLCFASGFYANKYYAPSHGTCKKQIENLRKDYKFVPRKGTKASTSDNSSSSWKLNKWSPL